MGFWAPRGRYRDTSVRYCPACGTWVAADDPDHCPIELPARLWLYTNYDCNLHCSYCLVSSSPWAERRGLGLENATQLLAEACRLGVREVFMTGGEPFILPEIYALIRAATPHFVTTVLSNAMILRGKRLEKLLAVNHPNLRIQVSLDDCEPGVHDLYRGAGAWKRGLEGIRLLQAAGVRVRIATTVTPECEPRVESIRRFVREDLGVPEEDHIVRPLLRRGFAESGLEVGMGDLVPEITVDANGVYLAPDRDRRRPAGHQAAVSAARGDRADRAAPARGRHGRPPAVPLSVSRVALVEGKWSVGRGSVVPTERSDR